MISDVVEVIRAAFRNTVPTSRDRIVDSKELEPLMVKHLLASRTWEEVSTELLSLYDQRADLSAVFAFLSDEANRYYLPAFMLYVLNCGKGAAGLVIDALLLRLSEGIQGLSPQFFSSSQRNAVKAFLSFLRSEFADDECRIIQIDQAERLWNSN